MSRKHLKVIKATRGNLLYSLTSLFLFLTGLISVTLLWHPTLPNGIVWLFIVLFFTSIIVAGIIAVRTMEKAFKILKISKSYINLVSLIVSMIVILGIIILIISFYGQHRTTLHTKCKSANRLTRLNIVSNFFNRKTKMRTILRFHCS